MEKIKKGLLICGSIVIMIMISISLFLLSGCIVKDEANDDKQQIDNDSNESSDGDNVGSVEITLDLNNYSEYFVLQEEIISYSQNDYTLNGFNLSKANQTTKVSIIILKENIIFDNVKISIRNYVSYWEGRGGTLNLAYDGSGSLTLTAMFDDYKSSLVYCPNARYIISGIQGTIVMNN